MKSKEVKQNEFKLNALTSLSDQANIAAKDRSEVVFRKYCNFQCGQIPAESKKASHFACNALIII